MSNKRAGVTLIELLIVIVVLGFITLMFSKQMVTLINNYTAGKSVVSQHIDANTVISVMAGEIQNTGLKVYYTAPGSAVAPGITVSSTDLSSFVHRQGNPGDTLTIYKARINSSGGWANVIDTITYYINGTSLMRVCKTTGSATTNVLAENVYAMQFRYGSSITSTSFFDQRIFTPTSWTLTTSSGTAPSRIDSTSFVTLTFDTGMTKAKLTYSSSLSLILNCKYAISLSIIPSGNFPTNIDSMYFSFRKTDGTIVVAEKFIPNKNGNNFTIQANATAAVKATIEFYTKGTGVLNVKSASATCVDLGSYTWFNNPATTDKPKVKIIRMQLLTRSDNKTGVKTGGAVSVGDVTVATTDNYTWRLYDQIIEIPNNGSSDSTSTVMGGTTKTDAKIRSTLISVQY
jgi:prepilin-type N-terminal cleavage/methylation domain-containing protein